MFTGALGNYRYAVLFYNQKTESFLQAHAVFFEHLIGSYHQLVYDNTRVAVKKFVGPSEKEPTESLLKLSLYYGFDFRFCNAKSGWEKGHVERSVEYVRRKAFSFQDEFDFILKAQEYLAQVCEHLNSKPQAANNNKSALEILEEERAFLLPHLPPYDSARTAELRVDKYSTVCIDNCHYSVPDRYVEEFIFAKIYPKHIKCYYNSRLIAEHEKNTVTNSGVYKFNTTKKHSKKSPVHLQEA
ncbi:transposase [Natranaerobius trueperi]|uniref:transposase n=1 Tax=Natranaerobius trueperi TaxID=759412 RepID=UPI00197C4FD1|nr:transposase [Natranaerobius trueperi]